MKTLRTALERRSSPCLAPKKLGAFLVFFILLPGQMVDNLRKCTLFAYEGAEISPRLGHFSGVCTPSKVAMLRNFPLLPASLIADRGFPGKQKKPPPG
ncbi:hypothetical protein JSO19_04175 [Leucobacter sp. UCMA 4100]|uniref:hypothetical protein n=1 Tax=Leucobacter sp. UCMA 4100 TaxID=2810534 RepID=UPI0022EAE92F|nr:hypothetical protein [Leucobacter sp. UCMA 4100]MDA3146572.1 hypothetical protein [Leucobacter sp. UCMA 4100]